MRHAFLCRIVRPAKRVTQSKHRRSAARTTSGVNRLPRSSNSLPAPHQHFVRFVNLSQHGRPLLSIFLIIARPLTRDGVNSAPRHSALDIEPDDMSPSLPPVGVVIAVETRSHRAQSFEDIETSGCGWPEA